MYTFSMPPLSLCAYPNPIYLVFSTNVPTIVYYSHIPIFIISVLLAVFVFMSNRSARANQAFAATLVIFSGWVFLDMVFWASNRPDIIMFVWAVILLVETAVYAGAFYMLYALLTKRDLSFYVALSIFVIFLPLLILLPTNIPLTGFDLTWCLAIEGKFSIFYTYGLEIIFAALILFIAIRAYLREDTSEGRKNILFLSIGTFLFLLAFASGNIIGSVTGDWELAQYGLFGMPIFAAFLTYSIVRYHVFNAKLFGAQALIITLLIVTGSQFVFLENRTGQVLGGVTFLLVLIVGIFLIRGVRREIKQREELAANKIVLEAANVRLQELDKVKNEFVSFATHQMRSPLVSVKWGLETLMDETASGPLNDTQKKLVGQVTEIATTMTNTVNDLLDISKIEQGGLVLQFAPFAMGDLARSIVETMAPVATKKGLALSYAGGTDAFQITGDEGKLRQVIMNLVDNSIKYTETGTITVSVAQSGSEVTVSITDTGRGFTAEEGEKLFKKFERGSAKTVNKGGSGLGIFLAKKIVDMHGGNIWATSPGAGQGSTFAFTLPINPPAPKALEIDIPKKA